MKKYILMGGVLAVAFALSASSTSAAFQYWNVVGTHDMNVYVTGDSTEYVENLFISQQNPIKGSLKYNGGSEWIIDSGTVSGNNIQFQMHYASSPGMKIDVIGSIASDGSASGSWKDLPGSLNRTGIWNIPSGSAVPVLTNKDQCKKDDWKNYFNPAGNPFQNQGDCVSFVNNGKYFVQSLIVQSKGEIATSAVLESGKKYKFVAKGTYFAGGTSNDDIEADAKYSQDDIQALAPDSPWTDTVHNYGSSGTKLLNLLVNGDEIDWGAFNSSHIYYYEYVGSNDPVDFQIYDTYPSNNTGFLTVDIYRLP